MKTKTHKPECGTAEKVFKDASPATKIRLNLFIILGKDAKAILTSLFSCYC